LSERAHAGIRSTGTSRHTEHEQIPAIAKHFDAHLGGMHFRRRRQAVTRIGQTAKRKKLGMGSVFKSGAPSFFLQLSRKTIFREWLAESFRNTVLRKSGWLLLAALAQLRFTKTAVARPARRV
jgi:hypothetical protein